jgi:DNA-binding LacI/PurR family transcriptional regulator
MEKRVTLKDVADALNISIGTVERAIHGKRILIRKQKRG